MEQVRTSDIDTLFKPVGEKPNATAEEVRAAVEAVFSTHNMALRSNLSETQVAHVVRALAYAELYECDMMHDLVDYLRTNVVSIKGFGRRDLRTVLTALFTRDNDEEMKKRSLFQKLLGRGPS